MKIRTDWCTHYEMEVHQMEDGELKLKDWADGGGPPSSQRVELLIIRRKS